MKSKLKRKQEMPWSLVFEEKKKKSDKVSQITPLNTKVNNLN